MEKEESLKHLAWATACQLTTEQPLEAVGRSWGTRKTGATQGDTAGPAQFYLSWHPQVRQLDQTLKTAGCLARFGMDDWYCWGPPSILFPPLERFKADIEEFCNLELEVSKSECFCWMERWEMGWIVYGCPVGTDAYM